jgi:hypothetical protein
MTDGLVDAMCDTGIVTPDEARSLLAAIKAQGLVVVPVDVLRERFTYLAKLGDWAAGEGFCQIEGVEDPEEYIFRAWSEVGPADGEGYSADALAKAMLSASGDA